MIQAAKLFLDCLSAEGEALDILDIMAKELGVSVNGIEILMEPFGWM